MEQLTQALSRLETWMETMHQSGGYAGPVMHWWKHSVLYAGPAIDWRYEGILTGYHMLYQKTRNPLWKERLKQASQDVMQGQLQEGSYRCSRFEINPGTLGTPHEAAATLGLLTAFQTLQDEQVLHTAKRNIDYLVQRLWDDKGFGFNDRPGIVGRVPNKLATLAETLLTYFARTGDESYLFYAKNALDSVLEYQVQSGYCIGAVHQYAASAGQGDAKFFPFYNARCVAPLLAGARVLNDRRYRDAAKAILAFLHLTMNRDGSWSQIVYGNRTRAEYPRWIAGTADILRAYVLLREEVPAIALQRMLNAQLQSGGFPTAEGFDRRLQRFRKSQLPAFADTLPVVGWNDKVFRLLAELVPARCTIPVSSFVTARAHVRGGEFSETTEAIQFIAPEGQVRFQWNKDDLWSTCATAVLT